MACPRASNLPRGSITRRYAADVILGTEVRRGRGHGARRQGVGCDALEGVRDRPLIIGASVRSGTTLLRVMVHSHPCIAIPREIHLTLEAFRLRRQFGDLRIAEKRTAFIDWVVTSGNGYERLGLDEADTRRHLADAPPTVGSFIATLLGLYARRHGAARFGEKRPLNVIAFPALEAMFPDLQFVDMVRDPRAVVASVRRLGWLDSWYGGSVPKALDAWVRSVRSGVAIAARVRPDQYLRLRYEDLVAEPKTTLETLCRYAGLSTEHLDVMLRFHETDHEIPASMRERFHPLIEQPLIPPSEERWRTILTDAETAFIEKAAAREMRAFGYEPSNPGINAPFSMLAAWPVLASQRPARRLRWQPLSPFYRYPVAALVTEGQRRHAGLEA